MKVRTDFVTNSSSTSFIITNTTKKTLTFHDFVKEYAEDIFGEMKGYDFQTYYKMDGPKALGRIADDVKKNHKDKYKLEPGDNRVVFGDEDGTMSGRIFDYCLRYLTQKENFKVKIDEHLR